MQENHYLGSNVVKGERGLYSLKGKMFIRSPKEYAKIFSNENHNGPMFDSTLELFLVSQLSHFTR